MSTDGVRGRLVDASCALAALAFTCHAGSLGVYLFDTSINYQQGWLIYSGYVPYRDFTGPLAPGAGLFTALGFLLFGVSYRSSVWMAALFTGLATWCCIRLLRPVLGTPLARLFGAALPLMTLPVMGTLYYNHLLLAFMLVAQVALLALLSAQPTTRTALLAHTMAALATLTKLHMGVLQWLVVVAVDWLTTRPWSRKQLALRAAFPASVGLVFALVSRGELVRFIEQTTLAARSGLRIDGLVRDLGFGPALNAYGQPLLGPFVFAVLLLAQLGVGWDQLREEQRDGADVRTQRTRLLLVGALGASALGLLLALWLTSGEGRSGGLATLGFMVACGLVLAGTSSTTAAARQSARRMAASSAVALLLGLLWFGVPYTLYGTRRTWTERHHGFVSPEDLYRFTTRSKMPFFRGITDTFDHVQLFDFVHETARANADASIFFGPSLEMLYAATGRLPPRGWPLWIHWDLSVPLDQQGAVQGVFARAKPEIAIFTCERLEPIFQPVLNAEYEQRQSLVDTLCVFVRKGSNVRL